MGLSINAFSDIQLIEASLDDEGEIIEPNSGRVLSKCVCFRVLPSFKEYADFIKDEEIYSYTKSYSDSIGTCQAYNHWRDGVALLTTGVNWSSEKVPGHMAFSDLLNFSDSEGVIGPITAKRIYADFVTYAAILDGQNDSFKRIYTVMQSMFKIAADGGAVQFR